MINSAQQDLIQPGMHVMVQCAVIPGELNGHLPIVALGKVIGPADRDDIWWVGVYLGQSEPLPQMYRLDEILGTPALGLHYKPVV